MPRSRWMCWQLLLLPALTCAAGAEKPETTEPTQGMRMEFSLSSPAFVDGGTIPSRYTCDEENYSPPLVWSASPAGTKSLALIAEDPDASGGTWVHWIVYNLPPATRSLPNAFPSDATLSDGTRQGVTSFGTPGYGGPCPPSGTHRYVFTLFAVDAVLTPAPPAHAEALEAAMRGHLLGKARLMGTYRRR